MCAAWTQDTHVFAMVTSVNTDPVLVQCAKDTQTPYVTAGGTVLDETEFRKYADVWYMPEAGPILERRDRALIESLVRQRFFTKGAKVGLLIRNEPRFTRSAKNAMLPALQRAGVDLRSVVQINYPERVSSPWPNYVAQFQVNAVTHVIFGSGDGGGWEAGLFWQAAENANYRPLYGISTDETAGALVGPKAQWSRARGVGTYYFPGTAVTNDPGPPLTARDKLCMDLAKKTGYENARAYDCGELFFIQEILNKSPALTPGGFRRTASPSGHPLCWRTRLELVSRRAAMMGRNSCGTSLADRAATSTSSRSARYIEFPRRSNRLPSARRDPCK